MQVSLGKYAPYAKTIAAFLALLVPVLVALSTALADGAIDLDEATMIMGAGGALVVGTKAVYQVPNKPPVPETEI